LAYVTGLVNQELLLQNEYLAAENRILKAHSPRNLRLSDGEWSTLAEIGKRLGRKGLQQVARLAKPDTILGWYRQLVAEKFDGSKHRRLPGRPRVRAEIENLWVRAARAAEDRPGVFGKRPESPAHGDRRRAVCCRGGRAAARFTCGELAWVWPG